MSSNALVDSLECYMEDLIDSFEDFVKKSLIIISVGLGALIAMLLYLVRSAASSTHFNNRPNVTTNPVNDINNLTTQFNSTYGRDNILNMKSKMAGTKMKNYKMWAAKRSDTGIAGGYVGSSKQTSTNQDGSCGADVIGNANGINANEMESNGTEMGVNATGMRIYANEIELKATDQNASWSNTDGTFIKAGAGSANVGVERACVPPNTVTCPFSQDNVVKKSSSLTSNTDTLSQCAKKCDKTACNTTATMANLGSSEEMVLKEVGLNGKTKCSVPPCVVKRNICPNVRSTVSNSPVCPSKHHKAASRLCAKITEDHNSCCSMCCDDTSKR